MKYLYIPIEIVLRELDSKLLLAHEALRAGFEVILGQKWLLQDNLDRLPPGVVMFKTLHGGDAPMAEAAAAHGHRVVALDEEVIGIADYAHSMRYVSPAALKVCDVVYAIGPRHAQALAHSFPDWKGQAVEAGNPRLDLLGPQLRGLYAEEAQRIAAEQGPFFLINTNFKRGNPRKASVFKLLKNVQESTKERQSKLAARLRLFASWQFERRNIHGFLKALPAVRAAFPEHRVVIRPHPAENVKFWHKATQGLPGVVVAREGGAVPWILAAQAMMHNGCTTGLEAYCLDKPGISYQPAWSRLYARFISNRISPRARTRGQLLALLKRTEPGARFAYPEETRRAFAAYIANGDGSAARHIVADLGARYRPDTSNAPGWQAPEGLRQRESGVAMEQKLEGMDTRRLESGLSAFAAALPGGAPWRLREAADRVFHLARAA
jgi:surface carbohydrate biosynthesis protein